MGYIVLHIDVDKYYVSAEIVRRPHLLGIPVGVIGNQGACVIAGSAELKKTGVKTGEPIWEAVVKCPHAIFVKRDFAWYEVLSRKLLGVIRQFSPRVEFYSIDEFFCVADDVSNEKEAIDLARTIQAKIKEVVGVPVTIGAARTRTLAKLFSDLAKPFGIKAILSKEKETEYLATIPVGEISGIGGRRTARLEPYGVRTCLDFAELERLVARRVLTVTGEQLWWETNGVPVLPIRTGRPRHKVISRGGSVAGRVRDPQKLLAWTVWNLERLVEALEFYGVTTAKLELLLSHRDAPMTAASCPLDSASNRYEDLLDYVKICLRRAWRKDWDVTHMHLNAHDLRLPGYTQRSLFDEDDSISAKIAETKRKVNGRHGRWTLRAGTNLFLPELFKDKANFTEICDIDGKFCF